MAKLGWGGLSLAAACGLAVVAAIAGTKTVQGEGSREAPARKILVVAIVRDPLTRKGFEEVLTRLCLRPPRMLEG